MSETIAFIRGLEKLKEGERSRLRRLAGQPLDRTVAGFDLFTGLWWPLRAKNARTPRREPSWLIAKLYSVSNVPHLRPEHEPGPSLPSALGQCEPEDPPEYRERDRFRRRFDAIICSSLSDIEPRLTWALGEIGRAASAGIDWALLLDDLSLWDRGYNPEDTAQKSRLNTHERIVRCRAIHRTPRDLWACEYLNAEPQA